MTKQEAVQVQRLQGQASGLWSKLHALAALTAQVAADTEDAREPGAPWGDETNAAARLAKDLVREAEALTCALDAVAIEQKAEAA